MLDVLLIDPSIIAGGGHHYPYLNQHRIEFGKLGVDVKAFASKSIDQDFAQRTGLIPAFLTSLHARRAYTWAEFADFANNFERDMLAMVREHRLRPDIILLPTADQSMILGLAHYLKKVRRRPEVLIWILTSPHHLRPANDPAAIPLLAEYQHAFSSLREAMGDDARLHIFTEAEAMAAVYQPYCGVKVETVTVRKRLQRLRPPRVRKPGDRINVVCVGNAAKTKGYGMLPETICQLNKTRSDLRFSIHGTVEHTGFPEAKSILESLPQLGANIKVSTDRLPSEAYVAWLSDADIVILPYDTYVYRTHGSAVFDECVGLGVPVVAPMACDFAKSAIAEGRAIGIESVTAEGVASAVAIAADRLDAITEQAARYAAERSVDTGLSDVLKSASAAAGAQLSLLDRLKKRWRRRG